MLEHEPEQKLRMSESEMLEHEPLQKLRASLSEMLLQSLAVTGAGGALKVSASLTGA